MTQIILTHSDLTNYLRCRRQFKWSVVDDWTKPDASVGPLALGTRVHAAIEAFHLTGEDPVDAHTALVLKARAKEDSAPDWVRKQLEDDILVGMNCVMAYRQWVLDEDPYGKWRRIGIEQTVETELLGGRVLLRGKLDLLLQDPDTGVLLLEDYKTMAATRTEAAQNHVLRTYQHKVYAHTLENEGHTVGGARYIHLKKVKSLSRTTNPVIVSDVPAMRRTSRVAVAYLEQICSEILGLMAAEEETGWYPHPQDSCSWCIYRNPCLLADEGRGAEKIALADQFQHGTRLSRYITPSLSVGEAP